MQCCAPKGAEPFTEKVARRDARRLRRKGLDKTARQIVETLEPAGLTVLEVGGGVGGLQLELLRRGATHATNVELSPVYEEVAVELAREQHLDEKIERRVLDFALAPTEIDAADLVVMHRVVCCSPDGDGLVEAAAVRAKHALAFSFPRDRWWLHAGASAMNLFARLARWDWRFYVHRPGEMIAAAERHGLRLVRSEHRLVWQVASLERP
jgi:magnesium-protoporphyrin O-methyltransferase